MKGLRARFDAAAAWWRATRLARALARFGAAGGGVLTGGIAYAALFSIFATLTLGYSAFMAVLGQYDELRARLLDALADALPGLVASGDEPGLIDPEQLRLSTGLSVASAIALVTLVVSAISAAAALRTAVRAMFVATDKPNLGLRKLRELAGLAGIALAVLVSAVLTIATTTAADWLLGALGWTDAAGLTTRILGVLVAFVVDMATFMLVVRVLAGVSPPRRDLLSGAMLAGLGLGVLRVLGTSVVSGSIRANPILAPFAVVVVLLAWVNLVARIVLTAAAWTADPPLEEEPGTAPDEEAGTAPDEEAGEAPGEEAGKAPGVEAKPVPPVRTPRRPSSR